MKFTVPKVSATCLNKTSTNTISPSRLNLSANSKQFKTILKDFFMTHFGSVFQKSLIVSQKSPPPTPPLRRHFKTDVEGDLTRSFHEAGPPKTTNFQWQKKLFGTNSIKDMFRLGQILCNNVCRILNSYVGNTWV